MRKINWYVGMSVYIMGYTDCKVYSIDVCPNASKPIEIECKLKNGELRYLDCTLDGRTDENMTTQNVFFESFEIPDSAKIPKRWRAEDRGKYYYVTTIADAHYDYDCSGNDTDDADINRYAVGNYFRTREEAEVMAKKIRKLLLKGE